MICTDSYTDAQYLAALRECRSVTLRLLCIRLDTIATFIRNDAVDPLEAANEINLVAMSLLSLAAKREAA
jgi:hypothetical protein